MRVKQADREKQLAFMPADYLPDKKTPYFPLYFEHERRFCKLSDEQAGILVKRLYEYAGDYACCYDKSMEPNYTGLGEGAAMLLDVMCTDVQQVFDTRREASFLRSKTNGGGRPPKDE